MARVNGKTESSSSAGRCMRQATMPQSVLWSISSIVPLVRAVKTTSNQLPISGFAQRQSRIPRQIYHASVAPRAENTRRAPGGPLPQEPPPKRPTGKASQAWEQIYQAIVWKCSWKGPSTPGFAAPSQTLPNTFIIPRPMDQGKTQYRRRKYGEATNSRPVRVSAPARRCTGPRGPLSAVRRPGRWTSRAGARSAGANRRCPASWPDRKSVASRIPSRD